MKQIDWIRVLGNQTEEHRTALFSLVSERYDIHDIAEFLEDKYGIVVRVGLHCAPLIYRYIGSGQTGTLRVSLCCFNETSHAFVEGLKAFEQHACS